jgi:hypothetical protein
MEAGWIILVTDRGKMDHGRVDKKIFESKPEVRRKTGRRRLRWLEGRIKEVKALRVR